MANDQEAQKETQAEIFKPAASEAAKLETVTAKDAPLPVDAPKLETKAEAPKIESPR